MARKGAVPTPLRRLLWDLPGRRLSLDTDRDFVVRRVLAEGGWNEIRLLRSRLGDDVLREVLVASQARGISPPRIRFFQLLLGLPARQVNAWVRAARGGSWAKRARRTPA